MNRKNLLAWYRKNARRDLPWRKTRDPYAVWVSEAMLQQTQVAKVIPYYGRFLEKFPSVEALARSSLTEVLDSWSGLGYYSRARNLHAAAQAVVRDHGGKIPSDPDLLRKLPGIGRYTAGAVASIAFDRPAPILDGNVIRVLCRYFGIKEEPGRPDVQRTLWELAGRLVPDESPGDFNQALMELGALLCTPRVPRCGDCPIRIGCRARKLNLQDRIPPPRSAPDRKRIRYVCGILREKDSYLVARRPLEGLLQGLWEFPGGELDVEEAEQEGLLRLLRDRLGLRVRISAGHRSRITQILSHREMEISAFSCAANGDRIRPGWYLETRWVPRGRLAQVPFTAGMRRIAGLIGCLLLLLSSGCATPGPKIDREELKSSQEYYAVKSLRHSYEQALRVRIVGEKLLHSTPKEIRPQEPEPFIGIVADDLSLVSGRVFGVPGIEPDPQKKRWTPWKEKEGCLIVGVIPGGPADQAGILAGDLLLQIGPRKTPTVLKAGRAFDDLIPDTPVTLLIEREGGRFERTAVVGAKPYPVRFMVVDAPEVNAFASPGRVTVTTGMLRFSVSDDELAVVLGHELAHLTLGHIAKGMGPNLLGNILGGVVASTADVVLPGVGDILGQAAAAGVSAPFSQNFEREADYVGLRYADAAGYRIEAAVEFWDRFATELPRSLSESFFNTHPTSPERLLRLKKTIEELKLHKAQES